MKNYIFLLGCAIFFVLFSNRPRAETWEDFLRLGDSLHSARNYDSAIVIGHLTLERALEDNGREDTSVAWAYHALGRYYGAVNNFDTAISLTEQALLLKRKMLPPDHAGIYKTMYNSAIFHELNGEISIATEICSQALNEFKGTPSAEYDIIIDLHWKLSWLYRKHDRYEDAINILGVDNEKVDT